MPAEVFRARREMPAGAPTEITIGDSVIMIRDGGGARGGRPTFLSTRWRISAGPINAPWKQAVLRLKDPPTGAHRAGPLGRHLPKCDACAPIRLIYAEGRARCDPALRSCNNRSTHAGRR
jgi:hypothetical protein